MAPRLMDFPPTTGKGIRGPDHFASRIRSELPGLGRLSWQEMVALADVILGTFWNEVGFEVRHEIYWRVSRDLRLDGLPEGNG
jgi:hypothetical protein